MEVPALIGDPDPDPELTWLDYYPNWLSGLANWIRRQGKFVQLIFRYVLFGWIFQFFAKLFS